MEATSELLQKLQRRRERMGERSPLKDISSNSTLPQSTVDSRLKDFEAVKVQQRRSLFEGLENQAALGNTKPGKCEEKIQDDGNATLHTDECKEPHLGEALISCVEDFLVAEDPVESIPSSPHQIVMDILADVVGASPVKYAELLTTAILTDPSDAYHPVQGMHLCPFPSSSCRIPRREAVSQQASTVASPKDLGICPFPSSSCRSHALEASATMPEQAVGEITVSSALSTHGVDAGDPTESGQSFVAGDGTNTSPLGGSYVEQSSLQSERASTWLGRKSTSSRRNSFSTQILKPLQDFAAAFQQSDSCVFNHLSEGDSATPSPTKTSTPPGVRSKDEEHCESGGNSPAWEDGPEPLEYCLLDYHGVLPEGLLEKIKKNVEMHAACMQKLKRENDRLRRLAHQRDGSDEERHVADEESAREARIPQHPAETRSASETHITVNGVVDPKEYRECVGSVVSEVSQGGSGGSLRPCRSIPIYGGRLQSEIARTESRVAELEEAIRREGQKLREKDSERKAVAREVEAIRCEARAHRAKLNKHMRGSS